MSRLKVIYGKLRIASPFDADTLVGPLIDKAAFDAMQAALVEARAVGGRVHYGERVQQAMGTDAYCVQPAVVEMPTQTGVMCQETFAPILYIFKYDGDVHQATALNNAVAHGLSSCIFIDDLREMERFRSAAVESRARTAGRRTCAVPPTPSTTDQSCR